MINEVFQLAKAMEKAAIISPSWHLKYKPIPNIRPNAPCVRVLVSENKVQAVEAVSAESGLLIRKYGSNQGSFPSMNLAPLYRLGDEEDKKALSNMMKEPEKNLDMKKIAGWFKGSNWVPKFLNKYTISMDKVVQELSEVLGVPSKYEDATTLIAETRAFLSPALLFDELKRVAMGMLEQKDRIGLALQILFYSGNPDSKSEDDYGGLSVVFDSDLLDHAAVGRVFTEKLNAVLMAGSVPQETSGKLDAFHREYIPSDDPMPSVKLAAGFEVSLRTMNSAAIPSLTRYSQKQNDTFPLSSEIRTSLSAALNWAGASADKEGTTWIRTGVKDEALFAYPSSLGTQNIALTRQFNHRKDTQRSRVRFEHEAQEFMDCVTKWKKTEPETYPENIQVFVIHKLNKGCSKSIYNRQISPDELMHRGQLWADAAANLPELPIPYPMTPFPLEIAGIINRSWRLDGKVISDKYRPISSYHGVELQLEHDREAIIRDLHLMGRSSGNLATYAGSILHAVSRNDLSENELDGVQETLVVLGMLLFWLDVRKVDYMKSFAFLLGQLLKLSDSLHELYCYEVRNKQLPQQLVGSSLYNAAAEMPAKTMAQLAQRINPYVGWAKTHRTAQIRDNDGKTVGPTASYYEWAIGQTATRLAAVLTDEVRFNDREKAELFIGYMAATPKSSKENESDKNENIKEEK